ncbi:transcription factor Adf-1-like [Adelges cooleyi]|uniref:transcription factor Adf-1-like n=1 Tax=Adelges cooleyi TaxID=133065 RepID=UPI00217FB5FD|nr:transcription factor Adf-1-like [Adelges cooleyi]
MTGLLGATVALGGLFVAATHDTTPSTQQCIATVAGDMTKFLPEQEEMLIEEVRTYPVLYDVSDAKYKDIIYKDHIWKKIASKIGKPIDDCKKKWKNIKDTHNRTKRKLRTGKPSRKKRASADRVSFLNTVEYERSSTSNMCNDNNEDNKDNLDINEESAISNEDISGGSVVRSKTDNLSVLLAKKTDERSKNIEKIKELNEHILNVGKEDDEVDLFFKSLAKTVKKLPIKGINEVKLKSIVLVNEIEEKYAALFS